jgi:hygromycin-B 7''-O-kinase
MLPAVRTDEEWQAVVFDEKIIRPAAEDLAGRVGLAGAEARVLDYLNGRLPVATPELLAHGEYENGWRYLLMSQLPGTELAAAWPAIPRPHQDRVVSQAGEMLAALHGLDPACSSRVATPACSATSSPHTAAASTRGNYSRTRSCTATATCPSASASSRPRPSPPWTPWP